MHLCALLLKWTSYHNFVLILYNFVRQVPNFVHPFFIRYPQFKFGRSETYSPPPQMQFQHKKLDYNFVQFCTPSRKFCTPFLLPLFAIQITWYKKSTKLWSSFLCWNCIWGELNVSDTLLPSNLNCWKRKKEGCTKLYNISTKSWYTFHFTNPFWGAGDMHLGIINSFSADYLRHILPNCS